MREEVNNERRRNNDTQTGYGAEIADAINQAMSNYATAVDPCGMCRHREHTNVTEICGQCCYYWGSKFDLDTGRDRGGKQC